MFAMMMPNSVKVNVVKQLARDSKALANWDHLYLNTYTTKFRGYIILKRKVSSNYWQFTVSNDITRCTFKMYEKEAKQCLIG
jgi:hypothetical protein